MTLPEHTYVGTEDDWYNTNDIGELIEQCYQDKTLQNDLIDKDYIFFDDNDDY
jgi:hypothetical protein